MDDNEAAAEMLAMLVEALGHEAMVEHHPTLALKAHRAQPAGPLPADIGLPEIDGYELARRIRAPLGDSVTFSPSRVMVNLRTRKTPSRPGSTTSSRSLEAERLAGLISRLTHPT